MASGSTNSPAIYALAKQRLAWLSARQSAVTKNIVNARTPKFLPKDVRPFKESLKSAMRPMRVAQTNAQHIETSPDMKAAMAMSFETIVSVDPRDITPSGNGVIVEKELMKSSETGMKFREAMLLIEKYSRMRKVSILGRK